MRSTPVPSGSVTSQSYTNTGGNLTTTGFSSSNGYTDPPLITSATPIPTGPSIDPSDTDTDGILTSSRPFSSGYSSPSNGSFTSTQSSPNATWYPSLPSKPGPSASLPWTTPRPSTSVSGIPWPEPEDTITTHVTSVITRSGTTIITLPGSYNGSATPTNTEVLQTLTSSGTGVSGRPSGSASGYVVLLALRCLR
ncbi:hypothetical protein DM02DRAFT_73924 [Periconia macrospinosa]|uniref:Uncharacterized protein n=1 Tax=Periconia macrospinosa TaxID=97972 RepID=A0A2V1DHY7_9PLEO|nr:hypothetical protein DM02DRAFT_73924 [Periconia macrospinosa]